MVFIATALTVFAFSGAVALALWRRGYLGSHYAPAPQPEVPEWAKPLFREDR